MKVDIDLQISGIDLQIFTIHLQNISEGLVLAT